MGTGRLNPGSPFRKQMQIYMYTSVVYRHLLCIYTWGGARRPYSIQQEFDPFVREAFAEFSNMSNFVLDSVASTSDRVQLSGIGEALKPSGVTSTRIYFIYEAMAGTRVGLIWDWANFMQCLSLLFHCQHNVTAWRFVVVRKKRFLKNVRQLQITCMSDLVERWFCTIHVFPDHFLLALSCARVCLKTLLLLHKFFLNYTM